MKRAGESALFLGLGLLACAVVQRGDPLVHLRLVLGAASFLAVGGAVERWLGFEEPAPFHRIALGQVALISWFYLRQALLIGVHRPELFLLVLGAAVYLLRKRVPLEQPAERATIWLCWWLSLLTFAAVYSAKLAPPSTDPEHHAFFAKLVAAAGHVAWTQTPYSTAAITYPSGFSVLNALWAQLSFVPTVQVADCQIALQSSLAVGLVLEASFAARRKVSLACALLVLLLAHFVFVLPWNPEAALLEGTARLAHKALLVLPLTLVIRAAAGPLLRWKSRALVWTVSGFALAFSLVVNPALLLPQFAVVAATLGLALFVLRGGPSAPRPARLAVPFFAGALVLSILVGDPYLRSLRQHGSAAASAAQALARPPAPLQLSAALSASVRELSSAGLLPVPGCHLSAQCDDRLDPLRLLFAPLLLLLALVVLWQRLWQRRSLELGAGALLATALASALCSALAAAVQRLLPHSESFSVEFFRYYATSSLGAATVLLLLLWLALGLGLLASVLSARLSGSLPELAASAAFVALLAISASPAPFLTANLVDHYAEAVRGRPETQDLIEPADLALARRAEGLPPGLVLLPGYSVLPNPWEGWNHASGGAKAVPLYSWAPFAFFNGLGDPRFGSMEYNRHVCRAFDLPWLAARGVRYLWMSPGLRQMSCVNQADQIVPAYFEEVLREGDRAIYRLREESLAAAALDPKVNLPLEAPLRGKAGAGPRGALLVGGPLGVSGWACDPGGGPVTIALELKLQDGAGTVLEFRQAGLTLPQSIAKATTCEGSEHGFAFAPVKAQPGSYRGRVLVYDGAGARPLTLAEGFELKVEL